MATWVSYTARLPRDHHSNLSPSYPPNPTNQNTNHAALTGGNLLHSGALILTQTAILVRCEKPNMNDKQVFIAFGGWG